MDLARGKEMIIDQEVEDKTIPLEVVKGRGVDVCDELTECIPGARWVFLCLEARLLEKRLDYDWAL